MNLLFMGLCLSSSAQAGWDGGIILTPILAGSSYEVEEESFLSARLGGVGGVYYRQEGVAGLHGRTRAVYQQNFGSELDFREIKMGTYFGPRLGPVDLEIGVDYMFNDITIPGQYTGSFNAFATPLRLNFDVRLVHVEVSGGPIFLLDTSTGDTREGMSKNPIGIGDEFFYMAAASIDLKPIAGVGLSASQRHTAYGVDTTIGANISFLFLGFGSAGHAY
jgi:hypothetical protein